MANDINVNTEGVLATFSEVKAVYSELLEKINELNSKKAEVPEFWTSKEATQFISQLDKVSDMLQKFNDEFDVFDTSLNNAMNVYNDQETFIVDSINAYAESSE